MKEWGNWKETEIVEITAHLVLRESWRIGEAGQARQTEGMMTPLY